MSCYYPLKAFPVGYTKAGKTDYKVCSQDVSHLERDRKGHLQKYYTEKVSNPSYDVFYQYIEVPCGQCVGCRLDRSKEWANRCMMELKDHEESWFVTLTYDDEHLPIAESYDSDTGERRRVPTLVKKDLQDFMKRLRKNYKFENKLRFYACGEYGSKTHRPHYHIIIFGLHLDDIKVYAKSEVGNTYYNSEFLDKAWQKKGFVVAANVTWETCAYTARYILKKLNGSASEVYDDFNMQPEFTNMSRKPGIGANYYFNDPTLMQYDKISISTETGGRTFKPPRYFGKLQDTYLQGPLELSDVDFSPFDILESEGVKTAESIRRAKLSQTSLPYDEYLKTEEIVKKSQIRSLKRNGVL